MTYNPQECASGQMWVVSCSKTDIAGFSLIRGEPPHGELAAIFIEPSAIGTGSGRLLLLHTLQAASKRGFTRLVLDADPGAEGFYRHFGATQIGTSPSGSIPGRSLTQFEFQLGPG